MLQSSGAGKPRFPKFCKALREVLKSTPAKALLPVLGLAGVGAVLALVIEPWPEGPVLLTIKGTGPHGLSLSDALMGVALSGAGTAWFVFLTRRAQQGTGT